MLKVSDPETKEKRNVDIKNYTKYILEEGTVVEKRDLLNNLKSKLVLTDKKITHV